MRRFTRGLSSDTYLLSFTSLFADVSTEMLYPILPIFVTRVLGASAGTLGVMEGVANATQYLSQGPSGWLADRIRSPKRLAAAGFLVAALAKPFIGASTSWPEALAGRFADRLGTGTRSAPRDAMIAGSAVEDARGRAFGLESVGDNLGAFIGPLVCALLLLVAHLQIRWIFVLAAVPGLVSAGLVMLVKGRSRAEPAAVTEEKGLRELPPAYWKYIAAVALFGLGNATNALVILRAQDLGLSLQGTLFAYAGFNLCASMAALPAGYVSDRLGRKSTLMVALAVFVITYVGFAAGEGVVVAGLLLVLFGVYQGVFRAVGKALAADLSPEPVRATGLGVYSATVGLTGLVASVAGGQLWDRIDPAAAFWYGAAVGVVGLAALGILVPHPLGRTAMH